MTPSHFYGVIQMTAKIQQNLEALPYVVSRNKLHNNTAAKTYTTRYLHPFFEAQYFSVNKTKIPWYHKSLSKLIRLLICPACSFVVIIIMFAGERNRLMWINLITRKLILSMMWLLQRITSITDYDLKKTILWKPIICNCYFERSLVGDAGGYVPR